MNPRKEPSKTLFTGRRSKYEVLAGDDEEKRRERRDRNRIAATKCREKRENVLVRLENEEKQEMENNVQLTRLIYDLGKQKEHLQSMLDDHVNRCPLLNNAMTMSPQASMIFGDPTFLASIVETPAPPLPSIPLDVLSSEEEEELSQILYSDCQLTNSACVTDDFNLNAFAEQELLPMNSSSFERLLNCMQTPTVSMENASHSSLFNSAHGISCAKQHTSSSDDDSLPAARANHYVC